MDTPSVPQKRCKTCQVLKQNTEANYRFKGNWSEKECRACSNLRRNELRRTPETKRQNRVDKEGYKVCAGCEQRKPYTLDYFHKREAGRLTSRCKECINKHNRDFYQDHLEEKAAYAVWYRKTYPHKVAANNKRWADANPEKRRASVRKFQKQHPEGKRASEHNRRACAKAAGSHTAKDVRLQLKSQNRLCWWCGKKLDKYHIDHRIPLSRGGSNNPENLCIACPECNWSKHDKLPHEWGDRLL